MTEDNTQLSFDVITELKNAIQIIDHAADQGAFKGWGPINQVLGCRSRLVAFIEIMEKALAPEGAPVAEETVPPAPVEAPVVEETEEPDEPSTTAVEVTPEPVDTRIDEELSQIQLRREELARAMAELDQQASNLTSGNQTA